jgi:DNA polymerase-3 subunit beta
MKIRCDRSELAEKLQGVGGIVSMAPTTKPILQDFLFKATPEGVIVEVTDLDISARLFLERIEVLEPGMLAVPAVRLTALVREIPGNLVFIDSLPEGRGALIRSDGYEFKLLGNDPREFPEVLAFASDTAFSLQREKLLEMLRRVSIAASRDASRYQLTGVFVEVEGDKLLMTATDGKRLTHDQMRIENPEGAAVSAILPNRAVDVMTKLLAQGEDEIKLTLLETEAQLSFGYGQLMTKVIEGRYPEYRGAIPMDPSTRVGAKRADLMAAVRSSSQVTDRETSTILFRFEAEKLRLESRSSIIGESHIEVPVTLQGDPVEIRFNPNFFIDALRTVTEEQIRMEFSGGERPGTIRGGQHYRHLLMPLVTGS